MALSNLGRNRRRSALIIIYHHLCIVQINNIIIVKQNLDEKKWVNPDTKTKYNVYKIQRDAYLQMRENIDNYDSIEKYMNRKIKKAKAFERDVIKINNCFENVKIEW